MGRCATSDSEVGLRSEFCEVVVLRGVLIDLRKLFSCSTRVKSVSACSALCMKRRRRLDRKKASYFFRLVNMDMGTE